MRTFNNSCRVIATINGLLRWRKELDSNCMLAFIYLDSCDVFNDSDICEMTRRCDAVVIMIASFSGTDDCQSIIDAVQTSNFAKAVYRGGKHCALFTPRNSAKASILESPIKAVPWNSVVPELLRQRTRARLTLLLQVYVRMAFLLRPKVIFIDHKAKKKNWCMQNGLSGLFIQTGLSNNQDAHYYKKLFLKCKKLTNGQVFGVEETRATAYKYKYDDLSELLITKIGGKCIMGRDHILSSSFNIKIGSPLSKYEQEMYNFMLEKISFLRFFYEQLQYIKRKIVQCIDNGSDLTLDSLWSITSIWMSQSQVSNMNTCCWWDLIGISTTCNIYSFKISSTVHLRLYTIPYLLTKYSTYRLNTPAMYMASSEFDRIRSKIPSFLPEW